MEMRDYLVRFRQQIDFADEEVTHLNRLIGDAGREELAAGEALQAYQRIAGRRKSAMDHVIKVITDLRPLLRRDLGIDHPEYRAIRWPAAVSPDPM